MPRVQSNGIEIEYESFGRGEPVLLIMGVGAQLLLWRSGFCQMLAARGFQVIRFDNRDTGLSTHLRGVRAPNPNLSFARRVFGLPVKAPYTLSDMAADTVGLMDALDLDSAHVVGMSMGGMIAQMTAIEHPTRVRSLTSFASATGDLFPLGKPRALATLFRPPAKNRQQAIDNGMHFLRVAGSKGLPWDEADAAELWGRCYDRSFDPGGFVRQMAAIAATGSRTARLARVRCPTLAVHGLDDPLLLPACATATARAVPGGRTRFIEGLGHDLPEAAWPYLVGAIAEIAGEARG
ncbi:MAG: alpha/beta hydrolase [bacterium]